jgi:hypothetical protein
MPQIRESLFTPNFKKGQTSIEYLLFIVVIIGIASFFFKEVKMRIIAPCAQYPKSIYCALEKKYDRDQFRYWNIMGL